MRSTSGGQCAKYGQPRATGSDVQDHSTTDPAPASGTLLIRAPKHLKASSRIRCRSMATGNETGDPRASLDSPAPMRNLLQ